MSWLFTSDDQNTGASASASVLPMSIQVLISFKTDWFDLLAVQGTLRHLLQQHSLKASILCYYLDNNGLIPGLGRYLEEGMATHSCLENPMDREAWLAAVHRIAKNQIQLSD